MNRLQKIIQNQKKVMFRVNPGQKKYEVFLGFIGLLSGLISAFSMAKRMLKHRKK